MSIRGKRFFVTLSARQGRAFGMEGLPISTYGWIDSYVLLCLAAACLSARLSYIGSRLLNRAVTVHGIAAGVRVRICLADDGGFHVHLPDGTDPELVPAVEAALYGEI